MPRPKTMMDFITATIEASNSKITLEEFTRIRNTNDPEKIAEAVERMEAAGGYNNLE